MARDLSRDQHGPLGLRVLAVALGIRSPYPGDPALQHTQTLGATISMLLAGALSQTSKRT